MISGIADAAASAQSQPDNVATAADWVQAQAAMQANETALAALGVAQVGLVVNALVIAAALLVPWLERRLAARERRRAEMARLVEIRELIEVLSRHIDDIMDVVRTPADRPEDWGSLVRINLRRRAPKAIDIFQELEGELTNPILKPWRVDFRSMVESLRPVIAAIEEAHEISAWGENREDARRAMFAFRPVILEAWHKFSEGRGSRAYIQLLTEDWPGWDRHQRVRSTTAKAKSLFRAKRSWVPGGIK